MFLSQSFKGKNKWYLYLFTLIIAFIAAQFGGIPQVLYAMITATASQISISQAIQESASTNIGLALMLIPFAILLFAILICVKEIHKRTYLSVITARKKIDWQRVLYAFAIWGLLLLISFGISYAINNENIVLQFDTYKFLGLLIVTVVFIPFQATSEEVLFRGYLMQGSGILFRYRWVALVITSLAFGLMHSANPEVKEFGFWTAMPQYVIIGLVMGYTTIKDDGMEIAMGLHIANNIIASLVMTSNASALRTNAIFIDTSPKASHLDSLISLIMGFVFILILNHKYRFFYKNNLMGKIEPKITDDLEQNC